LNYPARRTARWPELLEVAADVTPGHAQTTWKADAQRLAVLVSWLDGHLAAGGALPTRWAADSIPRAAVPLPADLVRPRRRFAVAVHR
jgi:hypothetical protein